MKGEIKKIAFVSDAVMPFNIGGKEKRLFEISTRLAKKGYDVTVYTMKWWNTESDVYVIEGVKYKAISPLYPLYSGSVRSMKQGILFAINCLKMFREDFDVVDVDHMTHLNLFSMKLVCSLKGKKMFVSWHEVWGRKYWMNYIGSIKGFIAFLIEEVSSFLPNKIFAVSDFTENQLKNVLKTPRTVMTIPVGVEVVLDKSIKAPQSDIIFAGRLLPNKNVDALIKSVSILKKSKQWIKLSIIGDGGQ
jgi:glycosyltransferase involved in cell wall biosynthesis